MEPVGLLGVLRVCVCVCACLLAHHNAHTAAGSHSTCSAPCTPSERDFSVVARGPEAAARVSTSSVAYTPQPPLCVAVFPQPSLQSHLPGPSSFRRCVKREGFPWGRERVCAAERFSVVVVVSLRGPERAMLGDALRERCAHKVVGCFPCLPLQEGILLQAIGTRVLHCTPEVVLEG